MGCQEVSHGPASNRLEAIMKDSLVEDDMSYSWSIDSAAYQVVNGAAGTDRYKSAKHYLENHIQGEIDNNQPIILGATALSLLDTVAEKREKESHQGFANYETWSVMMWINNKGKRLDKVLHVVSHGQVICQEDGRKYWLSTWLKEYVESNLPEINGEIDWYELAEYYMEYEEN